MDKKLLELIPSYLLSLMEEFSPDMYFISDYVQGKYLYMSPTEKALGYSSELFCADNGLSFCLSIIHPDDVNLTIESLQRMYEKFSSPGFDKTRIGSFTTEFRLKHINGSWIWVQSKDYIIKYNEEGKVELIFGMVAIINERKEKEELIVLKPELQNLVKDIGPKYSKNKKAFEDLSEREKQVVRLLGEGLSTKLIADELKLSYFTVETHRKNILEKLKIKNTAELIKKFYKYWKSSNT